MKKIILILVIASFLLPQSMAATFNVSTTAELRQALTDAASNGEDDIILLANGTYNTNEDGAGAFTFLDNESYNLTIRGINAENTILHGNTMHQILNLISIKQGAEFTVENLSFVDGNNDSEGGAIYVETKGYFDSSMTINDCVFYNNTSSDFGGAIYVTSGNAFIINSTFLANSGDSGGAVYSGNNTKINVSNSMFKKNVSNRESGGIKANIIQVSNSIFYDNSTLQNYNGLPRVGNAIYAQDVYISNSIFYRNNSVGSDNPAVRLSSSTNVIVNSIFLDNTVDIQGSEQSSVISNLSNNYINVTELNSQFFGNGNFIVNDDLGFVDLENANFDLTQNSILIDRGLFEIEDFTFLETDFVGKSRVSGSTIDIGPYEYPSTAPTITVFTYTGQAQEQSELVFNADYSVVGDRSLKSIEYDYGNGFVTENNFTFNTSGIYSVVVKITDNTGEFSTSSLDVTISELPWTEMTFEQRLVKAIPPEYYEDIQQGISTERSEASVSGRQYVQDNPSEFSLVPVEALVPSKSEVNELALGWSLISTSSVITDFTIFNDVKIIWIYVDGTWQGWSSDQAILQQIELDENYNLITSIPSNSGIWVLK